MQPSFAYSRVIGNVGKELVRTLLESCGYCVYPFGYESYVTHIKDLVHTRKLRKIPLLQRMPDLLVLDEEAEKIRLVEVITSTKKEPEDVSIHKEKLEDLRDYWYGSILAVVLPNSKHVFYAEKVERLRITDPVFVNFDISEHPITELFSKVGRHFSTLKELRDLCRALFSSI
jgi:hypothetical protein